MVRYGDVSECLASDDAFYAIAGGSDYQRLPLLRPWHIIAMNNGLDLLNETASVLTGLVEVGAKSGVFYGTSVGKDDPGQTTFWVLSPTDTPGFPALKKFTVREEWIVYLGFTPPPESLQSVKTAIALFGKGTDFFAGERR